MQQPVKFHINTPAYITRDLQVEMTHQVTGKKIIKKPYLDGTVAVPNVNAGDWRVEVKHPNLLFNLFDRPIKVYPDRPTFIPIKIPQNIFENTPVEDIPDADLGPVQEKLDEATEAAEQLADKRGGDPIYAADWNAMATTVSNMARATGELATLVSPHGHDHPEIITKIEEVQSNLQKFYDVFASTLAELQRQIQELALQNAVETAIAEGESEGVPISDEDKTVLRNAAKDLSNVRYDKPRTYTHRERRVGEKLSQRLAEIAANHDVFGKNESVKALMDTAATMSTLPVTDNYENELANHKRVESKGTGGFSKALQGGRLQG
ncbi:hypothetical protein [Haliangium sp.]|uniref:hypothetical protein n=1 Tax=Haliangium sp. TaxID=2663208 RepID=UPI003D0E71B1